MADDDEAATVALELVVMLELFCVEELFEELQLVGGPYAQAVKTPPHRNVNALIIRTFTLRSPKKIPRFSCRAIG